MIQGIVILEKDAHHFRIVSLCICLLQKNLLWRQPRRNNHTSLQPYDFCSKLCPNSHYMITDSRRQEGEMPDREATSYPKIINCFRIKTLLGNQRGENRIVSHKLLEKCLCFWRKKEATRFSLLLRKCLIEHFDGTSSHGVWPPRGWSLSLASCAATADSLSQENLSGLNHGKSAICCSITWFGCSAKKLMPNDF